ncbi:MAG: nitrous oxide reductase accessory protein NosL [Magnetospirillum sp.]|nr:nitrous oxide reductase accessory protein NosL [Magnetospirillum sp.]
MRFRVVLIALCLAACGEETENAAVPPPVPIPAEAIGHFCAMTVAEHRGPKGEIFLASRAEPVWFTSARDALAFTMLPEEPKDIRAIYVSDMAKSSSWDHPDAWVEARKAFFVLGSDRRGGMGTPEAVPFSTRAAAAAVAAAHGGRVATLAQIGPDDVLGQPQGSHR